MKVETISLQGTAQWNEDALVINESLHLYGVLDGATSVHPYRGPNNETGGYLASQTIRQYMQSLKTDVGLETGLKSLVLEANSRLREAMLEAGIDVTDKQSLWTSALAIVRISDNYIDYAQVGDCMIIAVYKDGLIRPISRDQVAPIDARLKSVLREHIRQGVASRDELWARIRPMILQNKTTMNTIEGYSVMSGEPELADFIEYGRFNRIGLQSILIVTDGLFLPGADSEREADAITAMAGRIADMTLPGYAEWLLRLEQDDSECVRYPRFKISDDKTGVWIKW
ncbi:protein phosphatase 2C domain-containing protein [Paenibacillus sp. NPDC056579]|uniref:protein phosphatase 2C domain-containing protein n=1 Tax=Paenibacillus sp. NPDC056579 TaxID=3345871 RepID=UPI0036C40CDA